MKRIENAVTKLFVFLVVLACVTAFFHFSGITKEPTPETAGWRPGQPISVDKIVIGVVHVDDAKTGFSYAHDIGVVRMQMELGLDESQIIRKFDANDSDPKRAEYMIRECIEQGANVILATSWGYMDVCEKLAPMFPSVIFANATGHKYNDTNFTNYFGRIYQARYLSGIVAGMRTGTNKIGFVAAMGVTNSEVTSGINAFARGIESVNPNATIYVRVTNSWFDPPGERQATKQLIEAGCDVIAQHCNTPDSLREAERGGVWGIGFNSDMEGYAQRAVLTSVIWRWDAYYIHLIRSLVDGTFTTKPYIGGLKEGMVGLAPLNQRITDSRMEAAVELARWRIVHDDFGIFGGVMHTNDGRKIASTEGALSDEEILSEVGHYYRNVIVKQ